MRLTPTQDNRTSYDAGNGAVRSFFGAELVQPALGGAAALAAKSPGAKADEFLAANADLFRLDQAQLRAADRREGAATESQRYRQFHNDLPVYGGELVVGLSKGGGVASAVNKMDYALPRELTRTAVKLTAREAARQVAERIGAVAHGKVATGAPQLYVYRHAAVESADPAHADPQDATRRAVLALGSGKAGTGYLVWQVLADSFDDNGKPNGNWEALVNAASGELVAVKDRRRYADPRAYVFWPDPITSSGVDTLSSASAAALLDTERREVALANLEAPVAGMYALNGRWTVARELEAPALPPPRSAGDFKYAAKSREFLSVMAYYWLDNLVSYLRSFGVPAYNHAVETQVLAVDAQGVNGDDNSHFTTDLQGHPYLAFGEGGVPDAADAHVIAHEYGHALHFYLGTSQNHQGSEEGFGDFLGGAWLDRFNDRLFQRDSVFPWDNNAADRYSNDRFFNTPRKFSDANFQALPIHVRGSVLAGALWELYLALGGSAAQLPARTAAADRVIRTYVEMLVSTPRNASYADLGKGLVAADVALTGGANGAAIKAAFGGRGLAL